MQNGSAFQRWLISKLAVAVAMAALIQLCSKNLVSREESEVAGFLVFSHIRMIDG